MKQLASASARLVATRCVVKRRGNNVRTINAIKRKTAFPVLSLALVVTWTWRL